MLTRLTPSMMNTFMSTPRLMFSSQLFRAASATQNTCHANIDMQYIDQIMNMKAEDETKVEYVLPFEFENEDLSYDLKGRNSKTPKKANHGARPCSSVMRKLKKQGWFKKVTSIK